MLTAEELEIRLERAREYREEEPEFFRSLLEAIVYVHAPKSDDHPRLRFIQFRHPDGFNALPFFTSEAKAMAARQSGVRVIALIGRALLEGTRGATLMLNPNDGGCVLHPEEVEALLSAGMVARIETIQLENEHPIIISEQANPPAWLMPLLMSVYTRIAIVETAYLLEVAPAKKPEERTLLIALAVPPEHAERAARATITAVQPLCVRSGLALDLTTFDPAHGKPSYLCQPGVERCYGPRSQRWSEDQP